MSYRTAKKEILQHRGRNRARRLKTFKNEEAAKKYAESLGIKNFELRNSKPGSTEKKIKIIVKR